ncbi:2'-5' RNA ligase family protein [Frankia sp. AgB32]|uniref:2'-5' RNA ligase family protein n=1 Tax=Frankia sp. AgB32 TaxID=631119 RepID=UPI00200F1BAF|nr:2'-5' RNA ligase family protein [Frankia sp. AgB32]MCK9896894.1 2'-5' RNA ligase family protein [Frankia sp. AgB32]
MAEGVPGRAARPARPADDPDPMFDAHPTFAADPSYPADATFAGHPAPVTGPARVTDPDRPEDVADLADIGVAIGIPEPYRTQLQDWRERLGDPNASLIVPHVTLLGPTTVRLTDLPAIEAHLSRAAGPNDPFTIRLAGSGTFRPLSPVVFVALVAGAARCAELAAAVRSGPLDRPLTFAYHPHVTVAHDIPEDGLDNAYEALADYSAQFDVRGFGLYERGADLRWRQLRFFPFGRPGDAPRSAGGGHRAGVGSQE